MLLFAVSTLEKLKAVPKNVWLTLGAGVIGLILLIIFLRKIAQMNKLILIIIVLFIFSTLGFNWIYERNEPAFLTPVVDKIAPFFPSKDSYGTKQKTKPKGS
ncbi:MAG TPA: hypothetical protein VHO24_08565 [Opitutaceae bacterium]|nr:hypothetical protein [Opitutaceae bacterium]